MRTNRHLAFCLILISFCTLPVGAIDWPNYRGPVHDGASPETDWVVWSGQPERILWRAELGTGFSGIVVADDRVYSMGNRDEHDIVWCLDAETGKPIWQHRYAEPLAANLYEGGPNATPTVDGDRLYTLSRSGKLFCLDAATGAVRWQRDISREHRVEAPGWGFSSSVLVWQGALYLNAGTLGMALRASDGQLLWLNGTDKSGYASLVPLRDTETARLLVFGAETLAEVDGRDGRTVWAVPWKTRYGINASDPVVWSDRVFAASGYGYGCGLLQRTGDGVQEIYRNKNLKTQCYGAVYHDGFLYGFDGQVGGSGRLVCLEAETGKVRWAQRGLGTGTVLVAGDRLIVLGEKGRLVFCPADPNGYRELAAADLFENKCWTVPTLANGRLYARDALGHLVCLDLRPQS